jgi:hypothetical protein
MRECLFGSGIAHIAIKLRKNELISTPNIQTVNDRIKPWNTVDTEVNPPRAGKPHSYQAKPRCVNFNSQYPNREGLDKTVEHG